MLGAARASLVVALGAEAVVALDGSWGVDYGSRYPGRSRRWGWDGK